MKILSVQNFALMMATVTVMVSSAPRSPDPKELLQRIKEEANNSEKHVPLDKRVTRTPRNGKLCVDEFFCWAEKISKVTEHHLPQNHSLFKLTRSLIVYNEKFNVSCPLNTNDKYPLGCFLEDIKTCVDYALMK